MLLTRLTFIVSLCSFLLPALAVRAIVPEKYQETFTKTIAQSPNLPKLTGISAQVDKIAQQITVKIGSRQNSNGSGAIVAKQGNTYYVLTAAHVVKNQDEYVAIAPDGQEYKIDPDRIAVMKEADLAVVQFNSEKNYLVATLANYDASTYNTQWVFTSGFPGENSGNPQRYFTAGEVFSKGFGSILSKDAFSLTSGYELVYSNLSLKGMSGGPVLDRNGRVIGVNTASEAEVEITDSGQVQEVNLGYSLGVPIETLVKLASQVGMQSEWLKIETNAPPQLTQSEIDTIIDEVMTAKAPTQDASAIEWLNYGNRVWRVFGATDIDKRKERYQEAIQAFTKAIELKPDFYQAYYAMGLALEFVDHKLANQSYQKVVAIEPNFYQAWRQLGYTYSMLGKSQEALESIDKAIALNSQDFMLYIWRGNFLMGKELYPEAREALTKAIALRPHPFAYHDRGLSYAYTGDYQQALADFNSAIELDPDFLSAYVSRCETYRRLGDYQKATADCNRAIDLDPDWANAYINRGLIRSESGDTQGAIADYNKAIELDPQQPKPYLNRGVLLLESQDIQGAIGDLTKAIALQPDNAAAYSYRGYARSQIQDFQGAIADYNKAIELQPDLATAYINRGIARYQTGDTQGGIGDINAAAQLYEQQGDTASYQLTQELLQQLQP
jgi:tetratricopeptide (TPR) repeat protein